MATATALPAFAMGPRPAMAQSLGALGGVGDHVTRTSGASSSVVLIADPTLTALGFADRTIADLKAAGHTPHLFDDFTSDPKEEAVNAALLLAQECDAGCIIGLGGGSALDLAKLVAGLAHKSTDCAPYRLSRVPIGRRLAAFIAVPTTSGTGSETTRTSIISEDNGTKNWFFDDSLLPDLAVMDPELTVGLPGYWTLYTGLDALVHAVEARTNRYRFPENDAISDRAIELVGLHLRPALENPQNTIARAGLQRAAAYAGMAINNTGCAVAHNIGHALGSLAGVPHGRAVSIAMVKTLPWAIEGAPDAFDTVAKILRLEEPTALSHWMKDTAATLDETLHLTAAESAMVSVPALEASMLSSANKAMLDSTARTADPDDVLYLASTTLAS
ncbi:MAG: iron-containing alcohol dehydrogenase [Pseudomonadota bacterium]